MAASEKTLLCLTAMPVAFERESKPVSCRLVGARPGRDARHIRARIASARFARCGPRPVIRRLSKRGAESDPTPMRGFRLDRGRLAYFVQTFLAFAEVMSHRPLCQNRLRGDRCRLHQGV